MTGDLTVETGSGHQRRHVPSLLLRTGAVDPSGLRTPVQELPSVLDPAA